MDNRRKYLLELTNKSHNEEESNINKTQDEIDPAKTEKRINTKHLYLERLLSNNSSSPTNSMKFSPVTESLPSFTNSLREILSSSYNKQKAIKYLIKKRNQEKRGLRSPMTDIEQEESNPVLSNKKYMHTDFNNGNKTICVSKNAYLNHIVKKNKTINNLKDNKTKSNDKFDKTRIFIKKKFCLCPKDYNINSNKEGKEDNIFYNTFYVKKNWHTNKKKDDKKDNTDNDIKSVKESNDKIQTAYKFYHGNYQNSDKKEMSNKSNEEDFHSSDKFSTPIPINNKTEYNFLYGKSEDYSDFDAGLTVKKNNKNKMKNISNLISKNYTYIRQRYKRNKNSKSSIKNENVKENIIEIRIPGNGENNTNYKFRKSYGGFSGDKNYFANEYLSFKDEKELFNYINKRYNKSKLIELFNINEDEENEKEKEIKNLKDRVNEEKKKNKENKKEINSLKDKLDEEMKKYNEKEKEINDLKNELNEELEKKKEKEKEYNEIKTQLSEEFEKNKENKKKIKKLEKNINELSKDINNKNKEINNKEKELEELQIDNKKYKTDLKLKEKEINKIKKEFENKSNLEENNDNNLKN